MGKLLIVDDDPDIVETMVSLLEDQGLEITTSNNAKKALELIKSNNYHTIISDISMPQMSGLEFLAEIRKMGVEIPLMFVSGSDLSDHMRQALQLGAADYLSKPFDIDKLIEKVNKFIEIGRRVEKLKTLGPDTNLEEIERNKKMINLLKVSNALKEVA